MKTLIQLLFFFLIQGLVAQENIVFNDDFLNNDNNWGLEDSDIRLIKIENGNLTFRSTENNNAWSIQEISIDPFQDFQISTNITQSNGVNNTGFGIVFGTLNAQNFYYFEIASTLYYRIGKVENDSTIMLRKWISSNFINGIGKSNNLTIKSIKNILYFYINNSFICSIPSITFFGPKFGIINRNPQKEILVDDFRVEYIDNTVVAKIAKPSIKQVSSQVSDVDENIPVNQLTKTRTFAVIIGNEDYSSNQTGLSTEVNVEFAVNDAKIFKEYCTKTLGIPEKNIALLLNATGSKILQNIDWISQLAKACNGSAELIFYYAGHGLPDEQTKEPYLIPVDVNGKDLKYAIKLMDIYNKLTENPSKKVTVFLDACFSGGARNESLLALRGVKIKPKEDVIGNNLFVFTSSSGEESSAPYSEKYHGMFTYFLVKKIQETKGDVTYQELADYLKDEVSLNSLLINKKQQTPQALGSLNVEGVWKNWKLK